MVQIRYTGKGKCSECKKLLQNGERVELHITSTGAVKAGCWECIEKIQTTEKELLKSRRE